MAASKVLTQKSVAAHCGVSRSTVAAVVRGGQDVRISPEVRRRVEDAIRELGYYPHGAGKSLRSGRTQMIGVAIPNINAIRGVISSQIFQGIGEEAQLLGYGLMLSTYQDRSNALASFENMVRGSRLDGFLFYGDQNTEHDSRDAILADLRKPYVILEKFVAHSPSLVFDNRGGGRMATEHLISHGKRRIAMIGAGPGPLFQERYRGYHEAMSQAGLESLELIGPETSDYGSSAYEATMRILDEGRPVDAFFCTTEPGALGCLQALGERGLRVPDDIAVVGYDDSPVSALANPALTAVHQDGVKLGRQAMDILHGMIEGKEPPGQPRVLPVSLTVRRSCGCR